MGEARVDSKEEGCEEGRERHVSFSVYVLCPFLSLQPPSSRARKNGWRRRRGQYSRQWTWPGLSGGRSFWQRARQVLKRLWPRHDRPGRHGQCVT